MSLEIFVRSAIIEDCRPMWEWWNDPVTRQMMKDNDPVPYESHAAWFEKAIVDPNRMLCVGVLDSKAFGVVRFLKEEEGVYEVSINLDSVLRGKGLGSILMGESINILKSKESPSLLFAMLKKINTPSKRTFEKNNFVFKEPEKFYPKMDNYNPETEFYCEIKYDNGIKHG